MKKITALLLALLMTLSLSAALAENNPYAVTEPITIEWWHSNEDQYTEDINVLCEKFHEQYPLITVIPRYIGSGTVLAENLIAAHAADSVPAVSQVNVGYLAEYFDSGVCTDLEPYLEAYGVDKNDFVKGYRDRHPQGGRPHVLPALPGLHAGDLLQQDRGAERGNHPA